VTAMKNWIKDNYKNWAVYLILSVLLKYISIKTNSTFLDDFIKDNLILLLPALLAVNVTTISILLTKIYDLKKEFPSVSFKEPILAMRNSITEQIILVLLATISLILREGKAIGLFTSENGQNFLSVFLIMLAISAIQIVLDTANALFNFLSTEDEITNA